MLSWAAPDYEDQSQYRVTLQTVDKAYQVFLSFPIGGRLLVHVVDEVLLTLAQPPQSWRAQFHAVVPKQTEYPAMAGPAWTRYQFGRVRR